MNFIIMFQSEKLSEESQALLEALMELSKDDPESLRIEVSLVAINQSSNLTY